MNPKMAAAAIVLWLFLANPSLLAGGWLGQRESSEATIGPSPENAVTDIFFVNERMGWIMTRDANNSYLFRTLDGGTSWERLDVPFLVHKLFFLDRHKGWAIYLISGESDEIAAHVAFTGDGGAVWSDLSALPTIMPYPAGNIVFADANAGVIVGANLLSPAELLYTQNGGKSFEEVTITADSRDSLLGAFRDAAGGLWGVGEDLVVYSRDGGMTWEILLSRQKLPSELQCEYDFCVRVYSGWMMPNGEGWLVGLANGGGALLLSTRDFGRNWTVALRTEESSSFDDVYFADHSNGCVVGLSPLVLCTSDGGKTWRSNDFLTSEGGSKNVEPNKYGKRNWLRLTRIVLLPSGRGWVTTDGGYLFQTDDMGKSWQELDLLKRMNSRVATKPFSPHGCNTP